MITKQEYMGSLDKEFQIIRHLATKLTDSDMSYKPTDGQRSVQELLEYLSYMFIATATALRDGDMGIYKTMSEAAAGLPLSSFDAAMEKQAKDVSAIIENFTEEQLNEEVNLWSMQTRAMHLLNGPLKFATAYKIQLFLYMKANGHTELNTMNLWAGVDPVTN